MLTPQEIQAILWGGDKSTTPQGKRYYTLDENGTLVRNSGRPPTGQVGKFEGRAGTMSRSRKGRTRRNANGSRKYLTGDVIAYKV